MQWRKHVCIKYGGRVGAVGQGRQRDWEEEVQVQILQLQRKKANGKVNYDVWHQALSPSPDSRRSSATNMLCCGRRKEGRGEATDISASPGRQIAVNQLRPKDPPPMVIQGDFRKERESLLQVSGITNEIFRQIETVENDHDASTAAALEAVEKRGEMVVRIIEPRQMGRQASEAAKRFIAVQDPKRPIHFVEIIKRPGQTLGLYIREGNGHDRNDGVFISRIAVETAVYNSGCLKVGDEIVAVNLVDVTHMSLDDVVIIMSIPMRLILAIRHSAIQTSTLSHSRHQEQKAPPIVVIKRDLNEDEADSHVTANSIRDSNRRRGDGREMIPSRSKLGLSGLASGQEIENSNGDLYYNSRPDSHLGWSYQPPPPPVITQQPKPAATQHFQPYERAYPKTLESLAEKVHSFYQPSLMGSSANRRITGSPGMQTLGRLTGQSYGFGSATGRMIPRSGSDQHLPRVDYTSITTPARHTLLRPSLKTGSSVLRYGSRYGTQTDALSSRTGQYGTLTRRHRPALDYSSDTEATCSSSPRSAYYYYRHNMANPSSSAISHLATLSRSQIGQSTGLRSNSLPRSMRTVPQQASIRPGLTTVASGLIDQEDDGAVSAPECLSLKRDRGRIPSSPNVYSSDEYRTWMTRTPSTSALYEQIRSSSTRPPRYTYSAENIHAAVNQSDYATYGSYRPLSSTLDRLSTRSASVQQMNLANLRASTAVSSTQRAATNPRPSAVGAASPRTSFLSQKTPGLSNSLANQRATSARRIRNMLDLESVRSIPTPTPTRNLDQRLLDINPAEFLKYKIDKPQVAGTPSSTTSLLSTLGDNAGSDFANGVSGLLWVHLLAGRGLRASTAASNATTPSTPSSQPGLGNSALRDLYCVLECDRVHKARTVVRTGDLMFDWDENFELDLVGNRQLDLLVYSWDPQYRHKLCYKGSVHLATLLKESPIHQLAVKVEPRGTIYLRLKYTEAFQTFRRRGLPVISLATRAAPLFGVDIETVVAKENKTGGVPGGVTTALALGGSPVPNVPIIVWRCVEEIEKRGLDIIGLYRLCGSATKKRILREAFERNARSVDLSSDNVPDINVITGVLKDFLRELPEPLFTKCLYQMMVDALGVCLPDDPQGNAKLMFSVLDCLPKVNKATLIYLLDHLALVLSQCNKMSPASLAVCFAPVLMLHSEDTSAPLDFQQPIALLKYLLEIWPVKSVRKISSLGSAISRVTPPAVCVTSSNSNTTSSVITSSASHQPNPSTQSITPQQLQQQIAAQVMQHHQQQQQRQQEQLKEEQSQQQKSQSQPQPPPLPLPPRPPPQRSPQQQPPGILPRTGLHWQHQNSAHHPPQRQSVQPPITSIAQHQQPIACTGSAIPSGLPLTGTSRHPPPPPPIKPRQIVVASPGSPSSEDSSSHQESVKMRVSNAMNSASAMTNANGSNKRIIPGTHNPMSQRQRNEEEQKEVAIMANGNGTNGPLHNGPSSGPDQDTPTSSVDTEDGNPGLNEEDERCVEGDAEASDDDFILKKHRNLMMEKHGVSYNASN